MPTKHRGELNVQRVLHKVERFRKEEVRSKVVTGIQFNEPFFAIPSPPPWAMADPCWSCWKASEYWGKQLTRCQKPQDREFTAEEQKECDKIRRQFFKVAREYANCMDTVYGLNRTAKISSQPTKQTQK